MTRMLNLQPDQKKYRNELFTLMDMGFLIFDDNIEALKSNNGNIDAATNWLFEKDLI